MNDYSNLRIGWLMPGSGFSSPGGLRYWEPIIREFVKVFPRTTYLTTDKIHPCYATTLDVHSFGKFRIVNLFRQRDVNGYWYGISFSWLTPVVLVYLLRSEFDVIVTSEFSLATLYAAISRCFKRTRILLLKEGKHPTSDSFSLSRRYKAWISSKIDVFLANTPQAEECLKQLFGVPSEKILCRPYLIPPDSRVFSTALELPHSAHPIFLYVGQLIPRKGVRYLLEAASTLTRQGKMFSLWIVGDGPQKCELLQKVNELNIQGVVRFFEGVPYRDVGSFYDACDVFVLPTLQDYRSVAVMEAAIHGKAILDSMYDGGATEFVQNGENGFVFDPRDPSQLANLMLTLMDTPGIARRFGKRSLEIMKPYSVENVIAAFCEAVDRLGTTRRSSAKSE